MLKPPALVLIPLLAAASFSGLAADKAPTPHHQSKPPGPALSPEQARLGFKVHDGFSVELVAAEPDIRNPVAMAFDEKGRIWVTESFEYPRKETGPGKDTIKILEDTDHDGTVDKVTVFADDLNIPSGIAVGYGGVWVANSPDILFLQDTDGDGKADKREVVVTGFGRFDTHELPNSLTWGPDGWLYGLNGVFNPAVIKQNGKEFKFTCAMFRIHPRTREFQVFAEGTSNPWGIAFDSEGNAFVSACVIDHLWHLTETGYYQRQGGAYPQFTWKLDSIVKHQHQKAAYCGLTYFDSAAYPEQYRRRMLMGNLHGSCVNTDVLEQRGSSYFSQGEPDFIGTEDVWFMPVSQKTAPDGCLYVLDWYDRYHCYQDAQRDGAGVDRDRGRLWRIRYGDSPRAPAFDLGKATGAELIGYLGSDNIYFRETAQRLLAERSVLPDQEALEALVVNAAAPRTQRMHAIFTLVAMGPLRAPFQQALLQHGDPAFRAWAVRAAGNAASREPAVVTAIAALATDGSPVVQLQVAIAAPKLGGDRAVAILAAVVANCGDDPLIPAIVWQNLYPLLGTQATAFLEAVGTVDAAKSPGLQRLLPRVVERVLALEKPDTLAVASLFTMLLAADSKAAGRCLEVLAERVQTGELDGANLDQMRDRLAASLQPLLQDKGMSGLAVNAALLAASWKDPAAIDKIRQVLTTSADSGQRLRCVQALVSAGDRGLVAAVAPILQQQGESVELRRGILAALGRVDDPQAAEVALAAFSRLPGELQTAVVELCIQRPTWSLAMLKRVMDKSVPASAVNLNQAAMLQRSPDAEVAKQAAAIWGAVRTERNPAREKVITEVRADLLANPGDPHAGAAVFQNVCGVCHMIYGKGNTIGPDLTGNGRGSFDQLLSNVLDPSLVIGQAFQGRTVTTKGGRALFGVLAEENDQRVVLKMIGGQQEVVPKNEIASVAISNVSLMPEGLENAMTLQQRRDLFAFLVLDKPPGDPAAKLIPGVAGVDVSRLHIPKTVPNLLSAAKFSSNIGTYGEGRRGAAEHVVFDTVGGGFTDDSRWHEDGVPAGKDLGVVTEAKPVWWLAEWGKPVDINLISLSGCYPNQPQPQTAWKIEIRRDGKWEVHDRGVGGWYDHGRYAWGGASMPAMAIDGIRVSVFSKDDSTHLVSPHFRGEPFVSWIVGFVKPGIAIEN